MKELGIANGVISGNDVYKLVKITETRFFMEHAEHNRKYKHNLEPENQHIPLLYGRGLSILLTLRVLSKRCQKSYHRDNWLVAAKRS